MRGPEDGGEGRLFACLLLFYILATCASVNSWQLYSATPLGNQHYDLISHSVTLSWHWANDSLPDLNNVECLARKWQVSIFKSLVCLDHGLNLRCSDSPISQIGRWRSTHSAIPSWREEDKKKTSVGIVLFTWTTARLEVSANSKCQPSDYSILNSSVRRSLMSQCTISRVANPYVFAIRCMIFLVPS